MKVHDKDHTGKNLADLAAQVFNKQVDTAVITSIPAQEGSGLVNHSPPPSSKNQKEMIDPKSLRIGNTPMDDLTDAIEKSGVKITFGIQPHHIEKIEARRAKINSIKLNDPELEKYKSDIVYSHSFWEIMGKECGWDGLSLALAYFEHKADSGLTPTEHPKQKEADEMDEELKRTIKDLKQ